MFLKSRLGWLPEFQPYNDLQNLMATLVSGPVPAALPRALSYFNGAVVLAFVYRHVYPVLPGQRGAVKGAVFGLIGWVAMGLVFFPLLGYGLFASGTVFGLAPTFFTLAMLLAYSVTLGAAYAYFQKRRSA